MTAHRSRTLLLGGLVAAVLALAGCVSMPEEGTVKSVPGLAASDNGDQFRYDPPPPEPGESPLEIVNHWLEAMTASPVSTVVAREFLTEPESTAWNPDRGILTYETASRTEGIGQVTLKLFGVHRLNGRGEWQARAEPSDLTMDIPLEPVRGQWRISQAPNALIVDEAWFEASFQAANLYFFDPSARSLVPEPVFLPRGSQLPTSLVRGLLRGPLHPELERSFLPSGSSLDLAVTVTPQGVAQVPLRGDLSTVPAETLSLMAGQLTWTLRQDPDIRAVELLSDGDPVVLPGGSTQVDVAVGSAYDPAGLYATGELYGLRSGRAVRIVDGVEQSLTGPFGLRSYGLGDLSVSLDTSYVAGVADHGRDVLLANVFGSTGGRYATPRTVLSRGVDLLHPAWDSDGRLWMVDRRAGGAVVSVFRDGTLSAVRVPGVSGERVTDFLVSRDGTRLVAAVAGPGSDRIVVSRIVGAGRLHGTRAVPIVSGSGGVLRVRDIGWRSPTSIYFVNALTGAQSELRSASVDGSPTTLDPDAVYSLQGDLDTQVVSSPRPTEPVYLQNSEGAFTALVSNSPVIPPDLAVVHYVG